MRASEDGNLLSRLFSNTWATMFWALIALIVAHFLQSEPSASLPRNELLGLFTELLRELGFALIIGVMIVEGIERVSRGEQLKEVTALIALVKTNVIEAVYGTEIANIFFNPFKERVITTKLLRKSCRYEVNITCPNNPADEPIHDNSVIFLEVELAYKVINCSEDEFRQKIMAQMEQPWPGIAAMGNLGAGLKGIKIRPHGKDVFADVPSRAVPATADAKNSLDNVEYELTIPGGKPSKPVWVVFSYRLVKYARDMSSFFTTVATEHMEFDFTFDSRLALSYTNVHSLDFIDATPTGSPNRLCLHTQEPMFPMNGIEFWWSPKPVADIAQSSPVIENSTAKE